MKTVDTRRKWWRHLWTAPNTIDLYEIILSKFYRHNFIKIFFSQNLSLCTFVPKLRAILSRISIVAPACLVPCSDNNKRCVKQKQIQIRKQILKVTHACHVWCNDVSSKKIQIPPALFLAETTTNTIRQRSHKCKIRIHSCSACFLGLKKYNSKRDKGGGFVNKYIFQWSSRLDLGQLYVQQELLKGAYLNKCQLVQIIIDVAS